MLAVYHWPTKSIGQGQSSQSDFDRLENINFVGLKIIPMSGPGPVVCRSLISVLTDQGVPIAVRIGTFHLILSLLLFFVALTFSLKITNHFSFVSSNYR